MPYTRSKAQPGRGSKLSIGPVVGTVSPTFTDVLEIKSMPRQGAKWNTEDVSNMDSGVDMEFITLMRDNGTLQVAGNRVSSDAGQVALKAAFATGDLHMFKTTLPLAPGQTTTGDLYEFNALVEAYDFDADTHKAITFTATLKISGLPVETLGT